jgi:two-component system sensor histidine kinase ChvG
MQNATRKAGRDRLQAAKIAAGAKGYFVLGHDLRIGQVITNLIENARSFVPDEAVAASRFR